MYKLTLKIVKEATTVENSEINVQQLEEEHEKLMQEQLNYEQKNPRRSKQPGKKQHMVQQTSS